MSRQTNDFQKLVKLVQQSLLPVGAKVTESALVDHQGHDREIDVLIESGIGIYAMKIAVEVKDHSRRLGPQVIEEYIGKYRQGDGIRVNQVVIVSRNGFTRSAKDRARRAGIILLTLSEAKEADWTRFIKPGSRQTLRFCVRPHFHRLAFVPPIQIDWREAVSAAQVKCDCCGKTRGSLQDYIHARIQHRATEQPDFGKDLKAALQHSNGNVQMKFRLCTHGSLLDLAGLTHRFDHIDVEIHYANAEGPLRFELFNQTDLHGNTRTIQCATAVLIGKKITIVLPDGLASKRVTLDIRDHTGSATQCCSDTSCHTSPNGSRRKTSSVSPTAVPFFAPDAGPESSHRRTA